MVDTPQAEDLLKAIPRHVEGVDPASRALSPSEAFVYTRIDGVTSVEEILKLSGLDQGDTIALLKSLYSKGVVSWDGAEEAQEEMDQAALDEEVDLDRATKERILSLHAHLAQLTHYQLLGIDRRADAKQIKKAYFESSRLYHPDTYFRKNLGSYKARIDAIFKAIGKAYDVLSNEQKRAAYDATLPYEPTAEEVEQKKARQEQEKRDARLRQERRQRLLKRNPLAQRKAQASRHLAEARQAEQENDFIKAANCAKLALALLPDDEKIKAYHQEVEKKAAPERAARNYKRGLGDESLGRLEEALDWFRRAVENNPEDSRALFKAASLMLELKRDLLVAVQYCRKVIELEPENSKAHLVLGKVFLEQGLLKNALRELNLYVEQNPLDDRAVEQVKELRKKIK